MKRSGSPFLLSLLLLVVHCFINESNAFSIVASQGAKVGPTNQSWSRSDVITQAGDISDSDPSEIIARRISVKGDVGGYYRQCVVNEAGRFRRLVGTMTPPDGSDMAEIYVEGKRRTVDGFLRWCQKGDVGLSQVVEVVKVTEEDPTGLYDGFYAKVRDS